MDSGRSTPEHLKKYSGTVAEDEEEDEENKENKANDKRTRTFSDTLKMLDDDILAELEVN